MVAPNPSCAPATSAAPAAPRPVSARKRRANRRNAEKSTGPRTPQGKARSARNATTHGIFCRDLFLPGEDLALFEMTRDGFLEALRPQDAAQLALVGARWRLNRCQFAEATLIEQRIAAARALVSEQFESLQRRMRFEDFSAAAIDAQCAQSELFRRHYQKWQALRAANEQALHPGHALAALMHADRDGDQPLERLSRYEHRLEQSFHCCLRDLHVLKQKSKAYADEPPSPFRTRHGVVAGEENGPPADARGVQSHQSAAPRPPSPLAGEGGGEGDARGDEDTPSAESSDADLRTNPSSFHTLTPHPNPLPQGEREPENANVQNEPTAEQPAATVAAADGCDGRGDATPAMPDPREMAALRKLTEQLSRCRPESDV